jgi:hypothetical protein
MTSDTSVSILPSDGTQSVPNLPTQEEANIPSQTASFKVSTSFNNIFGDRFVEMETAIYLNSTQTIPEPTLLFASLAAGSLGLALRNQPNQQKENIERG